MLCETRSTNIKEQYGEKQSEEVDMRYGAMKFPVRPALQELKEIATLGFDYVELAMDPPQSHHSFVREKIRQPR